MTADRVLVLGASGFLGTHVRAALRRSAASAVTLVSRTPLAAEGVERWVELDLAAADRSALTAMLEAERPTVVINGAGATGGDAGRLVRANVVVVAELLAALTATGGAIRLVHLGSAAEYGPTPAEVPVAEDHPARPTSPYGVTKLAATELVLAAGRSGPIDAVVLRVFNPIGAGQPPGSLLRRAADSMRDAGRRGETAITLGPLDAYRDFIAADDVAAAVVSAATMAGPLGPRVINVGTGRATRARELVGILASIAGYDGRVIEVGGGSPRSEDVPWQAADPAVAATVLGWRASQGIEAPVRALWDGLPREDQDPGRPA